MLNLLINYGKNNFIKIIPLSNEKNVDDKTFDKHYYILTVNVVIFFLIIIINI